MGMLGAGRAGSQQRDDQHVYRAAQNHAPQAPGRPLSHDHNSAETGRSFPSVRPKPGPEYVNNKRVSATNTDSPLTKPDIGGIELCN